MTLDRDFSSDLCWLILFQVFYLVWNDVEKTFFIQLILGNIVGTVNRSVCNVMQRLSNSPFRFFQCYSVAVL